MTNRWKVTWIVVLGLIIIALGAGLFLRLVPVRPETAIQWSYLEPLSLGRTSDGFCPLHVKGSKLRHV